MFKFFSLMLPSPSAASTTASQLLRLARPTAARAYGGSPGGPALPNAAAAGAAARLDEPGYMGYLSNAVSNIITNLSWNSTAPATPPPETAANAKQK